MDPACTLLQNSVKWTTGCTFDLILRLVPMVWKLPQLAEMPQMPQNSLLQNALIWVNINGSSGYIPLLEDLEYTTRPTHAAFQMFTISFQDPSKVLCWSVGCMKHNRTTRPTHGAFKMFTNWIEDPGKKLCRFQKSFNHHELSWVNLNRSRLHIIIKIQQMDHWMHIWFLPNANSQGF